MKKKILLLLLTLPMALPGIAQTDDFNQQKIDFEEDTTRTTSLNDIIAMQELVYSKNYRSSVINNVWKRKKFFTFSYNNTTLSGKKLMVYNPQNGEMEEKDVEYKTDWGVAIKRSRIIKLHKRPIADILSFGLEFSGLNLDVNHYSKDKDMYFDSRLTFKEETNNNNGYNSDNGERHYMPWGSEMYTFAYGIHAGPSITVAPFARLMSSGVAHIRLNGYFYVGYRASLMWMRVDDKHDKNYIDNDGKFNVYNQESFETVGNSKNVSWAHGLATTWGIRLMWKCIGVGYEISKGDYDFKTIEKEIFGSKKFNFSEHTQRISISYIW